MKRILVTGSRDWTNYPAVEQALLNEIPFYAKGEQATIVHGGCRTGADFHADLFAACYGLPKEIHWADWKKHFRAAGPIRNQAMVDAGADVCLAFIRNGSRGATDCARRAEEAGIPVVYCRQEAP